MHAVNFLEIGISLQARVTDIICYRSSTGNPGAGTRFPTY